MTTWTAPMFLTPERLIDRGDPQADEHEQHRAEPVVALVDELLDVEHPADRDRGVAGPRGDPVRPRVGEAERVAERHARVRVRPAVGGQPPRQRGEQQRQRERADGGEPHRDEADRAVRGERRRQVEDADADDAAHDQRDRDAESEARRRRSPAGTSAWGGTSAVALTTRRTFGVGDRSRMIHLSTSTTTGMTSARPSTAAPLRLGE